jgi:hypothetical protein
MSETTFFDEQHPTDGLPHWATITQVSDFLTVPRTTIRDTVRRAWASGEPWVKKEDSSEEQSQYLIDTTHETYKAHEQRWKQNQAAREDASPDPAAWYRVRPPSFFDKLLEESSSLYPSSSRFAPFSWRTRKSFDVVLHLWPVFRQRLYSWGMQVFQNILAEEGEENPWQWRWGDLHGEGYPSEEEAIIAAIESRLMAHSQEPEDQSLADPSLFTYPPSTTQTKSGRFTFFSRRNGSHPL